MQLQLNLFLIFFQARLQGTTLDIAAKNGNGTSIDDQITSQISQNLSMNFN